MRESEKESEREEEIEREGRTYQLVVVGGGVRGNFGSSNISSENLFVLNVFNQVKIRIEFRK